jgi:hypothetical protein
MSRSLFLVDFENSCQSFLNGFTLPAVSIDSCSPYKLLEVIIFVKKSTEPSHFASLPRSIIKFGCQTESPKAADQSLCLHTARFLSNPDDDFNAKKNLRERSQAYSKIHLVKGGEKGYGELIARF